MLPPYSDRGRPFPHRADVSHTHIVAMTVAILFSSLAVVALSLDDAFCWCTKSHQLQDDHLRRVNWSHSCGESWMEPQNPGLLPTLCLGGQANGEESC